MGRQAEIFQRAADCERLMRSAVEPEKHEMLKQLRDFWIALANECEICGTTEHFLDIEIAAVDKIQSDYEAEAKTEALF